MSGEGVQQAPAEADRRHGGFGAAGAGASTNQDFVQVDTTNILFIVGGAFDGLEKVIRDRTEKSGIGFSASVRAKSERGVGELFSEVEPKT